MKWIFRKYGLKDNKSFEEILPYHDCTVDDYKEFYPVDRKAALLVEDIKKNPDRGFICLDWDEVNLEIYGSENESNYQRLEVIAMPCNSIRTDESLLDEGFISPECNRNFNAQKEYLARSHWVMLVN